MKDGVNVYCLAYNHEKYIEKTLEGFVNQTVDFPYKVIVHDDASTDRTAEIIQKYALSYPDIIYPVYQKENQYSKGKEIYYEYIVPLLEYKYLAICEGDDYWTDNNKIKKQYDYMINNPDTVMTGHNTEKITVDGVSLGKLSCLEEDCDISTEMLIENTVACYFHTSSCMVIGDLKTNCPKELRIPGVGDLPLAINASLNGRIHYFNDTMSCYRTGVSGSWSERIKSSDETILKHCDALIGFYSRLDDYTDKKYTRLCMDKVIQYERQKMMMRNKFYELFTDKGLREVCKRMPLRERLRTYTWMLKKDIQKK